MENNTVPGLSGKKAPISRMYTGSLALHDMKGLINMVNNLLFLLSMVLVDIMAGTLQPNPIMSGIKDFPCKPR